MTYELNNLFWGSRITANVDLQPNRDIRTRRGEVSAASAESSPKAAVKQPVADLVDAASGTTDREAQKAICAKLQPFPVS